MIPLNAKALEAAMFDECAVMPDSCVCERQGRIEKPACQDRLETHRIVVEGYLRESGIGAVVEAAREWRRTMQDMDVLNSEWVEAEDNLHAAVAALEDRHD